MLLNIEHIKENENLFTKEIGIDFKWNDIDELINSDANILRPVFGYSFEYLIDEIFFKKLGIVLSEGTGDTDIDRYYTFNNKKITFQIKTPTKGSIKKGISFGYSLHKTHGLEKRPNNLYPKNFPCPICPHEGEDFPDFLIGKHPVLGVMIIPKSQIPESNSYPGHFSDPAKFQWENQFLNSWGLLGFKDYDNQNLLRKKIEPQIKFPKTGEITNLRDEELIHVFLKPENFRLLHMNLRGNLREPFVIKLLNDNKIKLLEKPHTYEKYDVITENKSRIQIKGVSKDFTNVQKGFLKVEVMGTHGKDAQRRYSNNAFDYLCVVIDPRYIPQFLDIDKKKYSFFFLKSSYLPDHPKNNIWGESKIYEVCKFEFKMINNRICIVPSSNYRLPIKFKFDFVVLNELPPELKISNN